LIRFEILNIRTSLVFIYSSKYAETLSLYFDVLFSGFLSNQPYNWRTLLFF